MGSAQTRGEIMPPMQKPILGQAQRAEARVNYHEYIRSNAWRRKREQFRKSKLFKGHCFICGHSQVEVHHKSYKRLGNERLTDLVALCPSCHTAVHAMYQVHSNHSKYNLWSCVRRYRKKAIANALGVKVRDLMGVE